MTYPHFFCAAVVCLMGSVAQATEVSTDSNIFRYPFYVGVSGGYGSSTWEGLVPTPDKQNTAINISMPTHVSEGGGVWGLFGGYELSTFFAVEASYMHYKDATVSFDEDSLFAFDHEDRLEFTTKTSQTSVMAKVMLTVPGTSLRGYSSAGIAGVYRKDEINSRSRVSPTFGVGANYNINPRVMLELGGNYTAGYGESELNPIRDYVPFLYSVFLRAAIRV